MQEHIEPAHWAAFFDDVAKKYHGFEAHMEVIGQALGDQEVAAWLPFSGMSYDRHHDQIFITVGGISSRYAVQERSWRDFLRLWLSPSRPLQGLVVC